MQRLHFVLPRIAWAYRAAAASQRRLLPRSYRLRLFGEYVLPVSPPAPIGEIQAARSDIQLRWLESPSALAPTSDSPFQPPQEVSPAGPMRVQGVAADAGGDTVGVVWICRGQFYDEGLGTYHDPGPQSTWLFGAHVARRFRRRGIYRAMLFFLIERLALDNCSQLRFAITSGNVASERSHAAAGARLEHVCLAIRLGSKTIVRRWPPTSLRDGRA